MGSCGKRTSLRRFIAAQSRPPSFHRTEDLGKIGERDSEKHERCQLRDFWPVIGSILRVTPSKLRLGCFFATSTLDRAELRIYLHAIHLQMLSSFAWIGWPGGL